VQREVTSGKMSKTVTGVYMVRTDYSRAEAIKRELDDKYAQLVRGEPGCIMPPTAAEAQAQYESSSSKGQHQQCAADAGGNGTGAASSSSSSAAGNPQPMETAEQKAESDNSEYEYEEEPDEAAFSDGGEEC